MSQKRKIKRKFMIRTHPLKPYYQLRKMSLSDAQHFGIISYDKSKLHHFLRDQARKTSELLLKFQYNERLLF